MTNVSSNGLLDKLLNGDIELLSHEDRTFLAENRQEIIKHLITIFSEEIPSLSEEGKCPNPTALFWGFKLAGFLEATETFEWIRKTCYIPEEILDQTLGYEFISEELPHLLADTMNQWSELKIEIEDSTLDEFIRSACVNALVFSVAKGRIERLTITDYFKSLFNRLLNGELEDEEFFTHLVTSCSDLWPGECLEEIREAFGLNLIDETDIDLSYVLEHFTLGKEHCIQRLQKEIKEHSFWEELESYPESSEENHFPKWDKLFQVFDEAEKEANEALEKNTANVTQKNLQRNHLQA